MSHQSPGGISKLPGRSQVGFSEPGSLSSSPGLAAGGFCAFCSQGSQETVGSRGWGRILALEKFALLKEGFHGSQGLADSL